MEKIRKIKKSPYFIVNILLLLALLLLLIGYANKINSEAKNKTEIESKDFFSTFEDRPKITNENSKNKDPNIVFKQGQYVKIIGSCDINFSGNCVRARACPSLQCPTVADLRNDMVLKTDGEIINFQGIKWYHIVFDEWVRYPDRTARDWYIASDYLKEIDSYTEKLKSEKNNATSTKKILVKLSEQRLYAYDGDEKFMDVTISSGLDDLPTPIGTFNIFSKTPSRYMQGPLPGVSDQEYDLPGVPWTMYFTHSGAAIHGAYWHNSFGEQRSHGCINLDPADAEILYAWADAGTEVTVEK